jgi:ParB family transcriptional regulator, chromosome partitioning protein
MKLENISLDLIKPYWRNPRDHENTIAPLMKSIKRYGFKVPIVVDIDHVIICGHARYKAMRQLGEPTIPCIVVDMEPEKAQEFRIADNSIPSQSTWNAEKLSEELRQIGDLSSISDLLGDINISQLVDDSVGFNVSPVMDGDMEKAEKGLEFNPNQPECIDVICPKCGEEFSFSGSSR